MRKTGAGRAGGIVAILLTASAFRKDRGLPTGVGALLITFAVSVRAKSNPLTFMKQISWGTLVLVAGLFILVDAVESAGAPRLTSAWLVQAQSFPFAAAALETGSAVAVANNLVNNLPLGLLMVPRYKPCLPRVCWQMPC